MLRKFPGVLMVILAFATLFTLMSSGDPPGMALIAIALAVTLMMFLTGVRTEAGITTTIIRKNVAFVGGAGLMLGVIAFAPAFTNAPFMVGWLAAAILASFLVAGIMGGGSEGLKRLRDHSFFNGRHQAIPIA